jgi:hypothetical protein
MFDYHATAHSRPTMDAAQDWTLSELLLDGATNKVSLRAMRAFDTGDGDDLVLSATPTRKPYLLWAFSSRAVDDATGVLFSRHDSKGAVELDFSAQCDINKEEKADSAVLERNSSWANAEISVSWHSTSDNVDLATFTIDALTEGYVAIGFSAQASMLHSDLIVAWVDANGNSALLDMHVDASYSMPALDAEGDVSLAEISEGGGRTRVTFTRRWHTSDTSGGDIDVADQDLYLLW